MAYSLTYFDANGSGTENDYEARLGNTQNILSISRSTAQSHSADNLFNGNIKNMVTALMNQEEKPIEVANNIYKYDQLNRISSMTSHIIGDNQTKTLHTSYLRQERKFANFVQRSYSQRNSQCDGYG